MSNEEWAVGDKAATLSSARTGNNVKYVSVERLTKTLIICDDGQRFSRKRPERHEGGSWGWTVRLMRRDDPAVQRAVQRQRRAQLRNAAIAVFEDWRFGRNNVTAFDAILALAPLTGVAAEIQALDSPSLRSASSVSGAVGDNT